jgi:hypothetical protein
MYVFPEFDGDDNKLLMDIQHETYHSGRIAGKCQDQYIHACDLLYLHGDPYKTIKELRSIDHRILQDAHDQIAAFFRFSSKELYKPLLDNDDEYKQILKQLWLDFYEKEITEIAAIPAINQTVIRIITNPNSNTGMYGESLLAHHLNKRYGEEFCSACKRFSNKAVEAAARK